MNAVSSFFLAILYALCYNEIAKQVNTGDGSSCWKGYEITQGTVPCVIKKLIAEAFSELNASYFAGNTIDISKIQKGIDLCKKQDGFLSKYVTLMVEEAKTEHTSVTI